MTGARLYRETLSPREALAELREHRTQFDPACVDALAAAHARRRAAAARLQLRRVRGLYGQGRGVRKAS